MLRMRASFHGRNVARQLIVVVTGLWLTACATPFPTELNQASSDRIAGVLAEAYGEVSTSYVEGAAPSDLALAGLSNMTALEPGLSVRETELAVVFRFRDREIHSFAKPKSGSAEAWAQESTAALLAVHENAVQLPLLSLKRVFENHLEGVAKALGNDSLYYPSDEFFDYAKAGWQGTVEVTYLPTDKGLRLIDLDHQGKLKSDGLAPGDVIVRIGAFEAAKLSDYEIFKLLRGPEGSSVSLVVLKAGAAPETRVEVERRKPTGRTYELLRRGAVADYAVPKVNVRTSIELRTSVAKTVSSAALDNEPLSGFILDLRGSPRGSSEGSGIKGADLLIGPGDWSNTIRGLTTGFLTGPGGPDEATHRLTSTFIGSGVISVRRGNHPQANSTMSASGNNPSRRLPLVVLVDGGTTGAAEFIAAALQDAGRAIVVGSSTRGYGAVRRNVFLFNLGVVNLRWAYAFAPSGYGIEGRGVMPDICTSLSGATRDDILQALRRGEGMTSLGDRTRDIAPDDAPGLARHRALCPPAAETDELAHGLALAILEDPDLFARLLNAQGSR